ncbi:Nramp family divalent metal transporter [Porticoccus sp. W117]|uniref:Nramp family divalent metal transporter n=1 Tax=Porticoccus sp. W117 TaxID=3054777 RepID=UPI002593DB66|nr:Nramp family divalent metal transporter [Porticoccus sp. W117]MDM3870261.1 Nramp family divalent metal transporter [Porticoccus sp. W117]
MQDAPSTFIGRLRHLGPGVLVAGSIVGSGELILTSSLGAAVGFALLWFLLLACWSKSIVQAELAKICIVRDKTYLNAFNHVPGTLPGRHKRASWIVWLLLVTTMISMLGAGGILGGTAQAMSLVVPGVSSTVAAVSIALVTSIVLGIGSYRLLETLLLVLVSSFTAITVYCAVALQFTDYAVSVTEIVSAQSIHFDVIYLSLALAVFGYTGVNSTETVAYSYFCLDKGYGRNIGDSSTPSGLARARGWLRVLRTDVWLTLVLLTLATVPFYLLGAAVLHKMGSVPDNNTMISVLSAMYSQILGEWAKDLFLIAAFMVLFSTVLSALGGLCRKLPDYLIETGMVRDDIALRRKLIRGFGYFLPFYILTLYLTFERPLLLIIIGGINTALTGPILIAGILYLERKLLPAELRPGIPAKILLYLALLLVTVVSAATLYLSFQG